VGRDSGACGRTALPESEVDVLLVDVLLEVEVELLLGALRLVLLSLPLDLGMGKSTRMRLATMDGESKCIFYL